MEINTTRRELLIVLTDNVWLQVGIAMMMPEVACCRMAFECRRIPAGFYEACKVFIAVDCRIFIRGEWAALDELLSIQTDLTVIWLTRPDTGLILPRARRDDWRVDQFLGICAMRRALTDVLDERRDGYAEPLRTLTMTEYKVLPYFLTDMSMATISKLTGIAEKTLYSHRRHIQLKAGFRLWCHFQHIHQRTPSMSGTTTAGNVIMGTRSQPEPLSRHASSVVKAG